MSPYPVVPLAHIWTFSASLPAVRLLAKAGVAQHTRSLKRPAQVVSLLDRDYRTSLLIMSPITA